MLLCFLLTEGSHNKINVLDKLSALSDNIKKKKNGHSFTKSDCLLISSCML